MSQDPRAVIDAFFERMWNAHDLSCFGEHVSPEVVFRHARGPPRDYEHYLEMARAFIAGFPDLRFDVEEALVQDATIAMRIRIRGTHQGTWRGFEATGRRVDVIGRPWARVRDGKVVEFLASFDELGMLHQLGVVPPALLGSAH